MKAIRLRCEQMENPLGIDVQKPCLSWICQDGIHQTAYEIEAKTGEDVIYNSGKVASDSMNVMLDADLASKQQVVWHVRLWDEKDVCDEWSQDAHFEMGIIKADQFVAKWINPEGQINTDEMQPVSYLRKTFTFDGNAKDARAYVSAHGIYEVRINGKRVGDFVLAPGTSSYDSYQRKMVTSISDYKLDFGAQYTQALNKKSSLTIGAVYSPKHKLNNDYTSIVIMGASSSSYGTEYKDVLDATFELPNTFGVGFTYNYDKRLTVGADYSLQQWSKTNFGVVTSDENVRQDFDETFTYCDRTKISVGAEYIPNLIGRSYFAHIKYRLGAYYTTPYYKIDGKKASREYGVTAGFGLPVPRSRSILSISGQFVRVKGLETNMVNENIFRVSIGLTFNERWFFKRRVE